MLLILFPVMAFSSSLDGSINVKSINEWEDFTKEIFSPISSKSYNDSSSLNVEHYFGDSLVQFSPPLVCQSIKNIKNIMLRELRYENYGISYDAPLNEDVRCMTTVKITSGGKVVLRICLKMETYFGKCFVSASIFGVELEGSDDYYEEVEENRDQFITKTIRVVEKSIKAIKVK